MFAWIPVLLAVTSATLTTDSVLRSGCGGDEPQLSVVPAGTAVEVRSALSGSEGTCYKVVASVDGREVTGYVPAKAVKGTDSFDEARRSAREMGSSAAAANNDAKQLTQVAAKQGRDHPATRAAELIEANQPAEALHLLEPALKRYPSDPYLLAVAGLAYYRLDNLEQAILAWRDSLNLEKNASVEALLARAEREKTADKGSERIVGTRVLVRYERGSVDPQLARAMLDVLDEEYSRVSYQLGCRASEKVTAVIQSRDTYFQSTAAAEWSGGQYDGRIHVPVAPSRQIPPDLRKTFAHELVHACLHELGSWPAWVQEGLAQKYSGEVLPANARTTIEQMIKSGSIPRLSQLSKSFSSMSTQHAQIAYLYSLYAAEKLIEMNANVGIGNLLRNPGELPRVTAELEKHMGF